MSAASAPAQAALDALLADVRAATAGRGADALRTALGDVLARTDPPTAWADGLDVPGTAYERLVSGAHRRPAGQFATPFWAADVMARWLLAEPARLLLDPGVGSGRLLFRALAGAEHAPRRLLGLDLDPLALQMAEVNLAARGSRRHELRRADFLLAPLDATPDAITCNPPYSRHHAIPAEAKAAIHDGFERRLGLRLSRLAGLHVLFLVRAVEVAAPGARIAFITPSDWLDVGYGEIVKRWLLERCRVEALVQLDDDGLLFGRDVLTTATITLLRKGGEHGPTRLIRPTTAALPDPDRVAAAARGERTRLAVREVALDGAAKWSRLDAAPRRRRGTRLDELARVRRGIATGANGFFVLSEAQRRAHRLPPDMLRPCAVGPRTFAGAELTAAVLDALPDDRPRWLLDCRDADAERARGPVGRYLREGREQGIPERYLASRRTPWFRLERRDDAAILFSYFNRSQPRFVRNAVGAVPLNTWLALAPREGVDPDELFALLSEPRIVEQLLLLRRGYGGGLWKLEPSELGALVLPRRRA